MQGKNTKVLGELKFDMASKISVKPEPFKLDMGKGIVLVLKMVFQPAHPSMLPDDVNDEYPEKEQEFMTAVETMKCEHEKKEAGLQEMIDRMLEEKIQSQMMNNELSDEKFRL